MRSAGLQRLSSYSTNAKDPHHIVNYFLFNDIEWAVSQFAAGKVLDIGCGNKPYQNLFRENVTDYKGCDVVQSSNNLVDVICPATKLAFKDEQFDTVFSTQVMEHVEDHNAMISEAFRVLKSGGIAIFTIPFAWELHEEPYDFFRFSKYGLKYLFEKYGFDLVIVKANGGKWATVFQLFLNALFSTRKYRTWRSFFIKHFFITLKFITLYNKLAVYIDKKYPDDSMTLNYLVVARKNGS